MNLEQDLQQSGGRDKKHEHVFVYDKQRRPLIKCSAWWCTKTLKLDVDEKGVLKGLENTNARTRI